MIFIVNNYFSRVDASVSLSLLMQTVYQNLDLSQHDFTLFDSWLVIIQILL